MANPGPLSFAVGVITPRWLYVLMAMTPEAGSDQLFLNETLSVLDLDAMDPGDMAGIRVQIRDSLRKYEGGVRSGRREALAGSKAVTREGLKDALKDFNAIGEGLVDRLRAFREGGVRVLGSLIIGSAGNGPRSSDLDQTEQIALVHPGSSTASRKTAMPYVRMFAEWVTPALPRPAPTTDS